MKQINIFDTYLYCAFIIMLCPIKSITIPTASDFSTKKPNHCPSITVYIHGSHGFREFFDNNFGFFIKNMNLLLFNSKHGLHKAQDIGDQYHYTILAKELGHIAPENFSLSHFYVFGWGGNNRPQVRKKQALTLYHDLQALTKSYH